MISHLSIHKSRWCDFSVKCVLLDETVALLVVIAIELICSMQKMDWNMKLLFAFPVALYAIFAVARYLSFKILDAGICLVLAHNVVNKEYGKCFSWDSILLGISFSFSFVFLQIEKIVLFVLEQQGLLASRIQELGEQHKVLLEKPDISQICELQEAYRTTGYDLLKLLRFVDMNATGLRKILKKFDKRFHSRFTDYYVSSRASHPYSQLQQVFKHVVLFLSSLFFPMFVWPKQT